jgi:peptidoglycan hydrolase-like protein with peptidoglycan-binding domain
MIKAMQIEINRSYGATLIIDGSWGPASKAACPNIQKGASGYLVWLLQACLAVKGYVLETDYSFGPETVSAVNAFQTANNLTV